MSELLLLLRALGASVDVREVKRMHAAQEILDTEQRYVACLTSVVDNYKAALEESLRSVVVAPWRSLVAQRRRRAART